MTDSSPSRNNIQIEGILELAANKNGQLLSAANGFKPLKSDPFVPAELVKRFKIKRGSHIVAQAVKDDRFPNPRIKFIDFIDGLKVDERRKKLDFTQLTTTLPNKQLNLESQDGRMTTRMIDLFCPIGKGQRGLIVAPPRSGKTTLLYDIARGIKENNPECHLMILLVDERPEEVTDFKRTVDAELFASSNDENLENHIRVAEFAIERAKRLVEVGRDVVILLDSLTRLARVYNSAGAGTGRTMTGGLDVKALEKPRQLFSSARNTEEAGSLTIIASALVETGSRMDDLIFQEFKGTGNMEMVLDRKIAEMRLWPAINVNASGTRREEEILSPDILSKVSFFRRALASMKPDEAAETTIFRMKKTKSNQEFLKLLSC